MKTEELFALVRNGDLAGISDLAGTDYFKSVGKNGQSLLHEAISFAQIEIAKYLIEIGVDINIPCKKGQSALHYCAIYKNLDLAVLLVSKGADINLADIHGNNAAWYSALTAGNPVSLEILKLLKQGGVDLERKNLAGRSVKDIYPLA